MGTGYSGVNNGGLTATGGGRGADGGAGYGYLGMVFASGAPSSPSNFHSTLLLSFSLIITLFCALCLHPS